jgi:hypothetical protein
MKKKFASVCAAALLWLSVSALAHHGDSGRYEDTLTTVTGTVAELQLVNPHSILVLDVVENGKVVKWRGELGSAQVVKRWCWSKDRIKGGDKITMTGRRLKNGSPYMTLSEGARVYDANGKELFRGNNPGQPPPTPPPCTTAQ